MSKDDDTIGKVYFDIDEALEEIHSEQHDYALNAYAVYEEQTNQRIAKLESVITRVAILTTEMMNIILELKEDDDGNS